MSPELSAFLASWSWEPTILAGLALSAGLYAVGWRRLRSRGKGRAVPAVWRVLCYFAALLSLGVALLSPIATFSALLFFLHMAQHLLLIMVAAPLLWLGAPLLPLLWGLPRGARRAIGLLFASGSPLQRLARFLTRPVMAAALYLVTVTAWHVPILYDAAQGRTLTHDLQHLMFLGTALLYWWPVIQPTGRRRLSYGAAVLYLFPAMAEGNLVGALITFADQPLYEKYRLAPHIWGLSAIQDQQIGGLLMWVVGGLLYLIPVFTLVGLPLRGEDEEVLAEPEVL